jgi:Na+-transporting methylmalonyl-CoA/oxaloacetate decarboxylase gamma subunit
MQLAALLATDAMVNILGVGLIALGLVLLVITISFWKSAVEDNSVLAPLEVMADRRFARANDSRRLAMLNKVRPEGAEPVTQLASPPVLLREPVSEPAKPFRDPFPHDDDAVDVVPSTIDPLLGGR